jgi:release factor glutamine methyltransferase
MSEWKSEVLAKLSAAGIEGAAHEAEQIARVAVEDAGEAEAGVRALRMAEERARGQLLPFVLGRATFMGIEMLSDPGALVPRAETEILGRGAVRRIEALVPLNPSGLRLIDMCCGAGNLACALATRFPSARVWGSDLTDGCVGLARRNVAHLGLAERVAIHQGDLFEGLASLGLEGQMDAVVCNPPYISTGRLDKDRAHLLAHEPVEAFDGGPYGLSIHQRVIKDALGYIRPGGWLMFEFGAGQERQIELLFRRGRQYEAVEFENDAAGSPRAAFGKKKGE